MKGRTRPYTVSPSFLISRAAKGPPMHELNNAIPVSVGDGSLTPSRVFGPAGNPGTSVRLQVVRKC